MVKIPVMMAWSKPERLLATLRSTALNRRFVVAYLYESGQLLAEDKILR